MIVHLAIKFILVLRLPPKWGDRTLLYMKNQSLLFVYRYFIFVYKTFINRLTLV